MWHLLSFLVGICVGSFLNVLIYRSTQEGLRVWSPPFSFCPNCKSKIAWYDNVPILSYLILKGRCRNCGWKIPLRYPIVELLGGVSFLLNFTVFKNDLFSFVLACLLSSSLIALSFVDLETMLIPDFLNFTVLGCSLVLAIKGDFLEHLISFGVIAGIFLVLKLVYREGLGSGDVILAMGIGLLLTPFSGILAVLTAAVSGILFATITNRKNLGLKLRIPFGPFLALGGYLFFLLERGTGWF